jgi:hypothetical protein
VQWWRKPAGFHDISPTIGTKPGCRFVPINPINDAESSVEIEQFRAASHENMLAIIKDLPGPSIDETAGAATESAA